MILKVIRKEEGYMGVGVGAVCNNGRPETQIRKQLLGRDLGSRLVGDQGKCKGPGAGETP